MANSIRRIGVVLFQLGGPDTLEAIQPFLFNLFCDPDIIDFPCAGLAREPLARLIAATRAKKVRRHYAEIGGGSPIRRLTEQQAAALQHKLVRSGLDVRCFVAMRYWHPFTSEAIARLHAAACDEVVLLPMYPQYSTTTTGSSLNEWQRRFPHEVPVHLIASFHDHPLYVQSVVEKIDEVLARFPEPGRPTILFSAHSVPQAVIARGDPYQRQTEETVRLVMQQGRWPNRYRLCYQSKVGTSKWLQPALRQGLRELATERVTDVCVVPISFVSDHVETLGEIDHDARELAGALGIARFELTPGLNDSPTFISALAEMVRSALLVSENSGWQPTTNDIAAAQSVAAD
ncbi:MAG: ferrochelatase [Terriglobales bacterium]